MQFFCSMSFHISGHQNVFASDNFFVVPERGTKCEIVFFSGLLVRKPGRPRRLNPTEWIVCRQPFVDLVSFSLVFGDQQSLRILTLSSSVSTTF